MISVGFVNQTLKIFIHHIASSCSHLSSRYHLPLRHNIIAKCVYNNLLINDGQNRKLLQEPDQIYNTNDKENWWDTPITTATKIKQNKPDLVIWNKTEKICTITEKYLVCLVQWKYFELS